MKYPRTYHLSYSKGATSDDKIQYDLSYIANRSILISEKMDGENTAMSKYKCHARSEDSNNHPSRNWVKGLWGSIKHDIPENFKIFGENLYAKHSIHYTNLPTYFMVYSIWEKDYCLDWEETNYWCNLLNLQTVKVLSYDDQIGLDGKFKNFDPKSLDYNLQEGFVIRPTDGFYLKDFDKLVLKYVRANHSPSNKHWMYQPIIKNLLKD